MGAGQERIVLHTVNRFSQQNPPQGNREPNNAVFLLYRLYGSDLGDSPNFGGVPLPSITVYDPHDEILEHFEECDPYAPGIEPATDGTKFPTLPLADHRTDYPTNVAIGSNWNLPVDIFSNADVLYVQACYSRRLGEIAVVRGKALLTPDTRGGEPVSSTGIDTQLWTVCNYNFWNGYANDCYMDHDFPLDSEGYYTIVISEEQYRPTNATREENVLWMDWGSFLDGQLTWRIVYYDDPMVQELKTAIETDEASEEIAPYVPKVCPCSREVFKQYGWQGCMERYVPPTLE